MCGLFGLYKKDNWDFDILRNALNTLIHRGPDQWGEWHDDDVYIGHRRLSINDLSENGRQPIYDHDQDVIVTVNGEIYNYKEIKSELKNKYYFSSMSDSEVILHGYKEWGIKKLLNRIDGMYAINIYDKHKKIIYLARDRVGIKPLFYLRANNSIIWASELKAIVKYCNLNKISLKINYESVYDYLTYLYIPSPKTLYKNIFKIEPAKILEYNINSNDLHITSYWNIDVKNNEINLQNAQEILKDLISNSVKNQLISDVPVGYFLSGGIDSSIIVAEATKYQNESHTFSIGFDVKSHDETYYSDIVSKKFNTNHNKKIVTYNDAIKYFFKIRDWYDEPFADTSAIPTYIVSKFAKDQVTVVLSGDGGDEIFGGYSLYNNFIYYRNREFISRFMKNKIFNYYTNVLVIDKYLKKIYNRFNNFIIKDELELYAKLMGGMIKQQKQHYAKLFGITDDYDDYWYYRKYYRSDLSIITRLQYLDFHTYLHDDILTKVDRVSMAVSLEVRVPLLSIDLIEYMFSLPEHIRLRNGLKGLVKNAYKSVLPNEIINRKKKGFSIPNYANIFFSNENKFKQEIIIEKLFDNIM